MSYDEIVSTAEYAKLSLVRARYYAIKENWYKAAKSKLEAELAFVDVLEWFVSKETP